MEELAGIFLALVGAGILIALIKGGWTGAGGVRDWLHVKFLGKAAT